MASNKAVVRIRNLVKRYGELVAVDHLSLDIAPGEVFGLLGPNGSGKTTTINCILQLLSYDHGEIELFGQSMRPTSYQLKRRIGVVPQEVAVFDELTVRENVDSFCALYVRDRARRRELVDAAIDFVGLQKFEGFRPKSFMAQFSASTLPVDRAPARAHHHGRAHRGRRPAEPRVDPPGHRAPERRGRHRDLHLALHGGGRWFPFSAS